MSTRRRSRLTPSFERVETRLTPSGGVGDIHGLFGPSFTDQFHDILLLFHQVSLSARESSREVRNAERDRAVVEQQASAEKIREAAHFALQAGIVSGTATIAGAISGIGTSLGAHGSKAGDRASEHQEAQKLSAMASSTQAALQHQIDLQHHIELVLKELQAIQEQDNNVNYKPKVVDGGLIGAAHPW